LKRLEGFEGAAVVVLGGGRADEVVGRAKNLLASLE